MPESKRSIVLVTPVWNDSARLAAFGPSLAEALRNAGMRVHWVVADDGSSAGEKDALKNLVALFRETYPGVELMAFDERSRKGGATAAVRDPEFNNGTPERIS